MKASLQCSPQGISSLRSDIPLRLRRRLANKKEKQEMSELSPVSLFFGGEGGMRTPGTLIEYVSLANWWFKPLTHLTGDCLNQI